MNDTINTKCDLYYTNQSKFQFLEVVYRGTTSSDWKYKFHDLEL